MKHQGLSAALLLAASVAAGCFEFAPSLAELSCADDRICPPGQFCDSTDLSCRSIGDDESDGGTEDGPTDEDARASFCSDDDIVLCLAFEETLTDGSARNNAVTFGSSSVHYESEGVSGKALRFDGSTGLLVEDYRPASPQETIEFWMTIPPSSQRQAAISSESVVVIGAESGKAHISSGDNAGTSTGIADGKFHHIAVRISGGSVDLLVDGNPTTSIAHTDGSSSPDMSIGDHFGGNGYVGSIDSLRVWTRALSDTEIAEIAIH